LRFVLLDSSQPLIDRLLIFRNAPEKERREVFDLVKPSLEAEFKLSPLSRSLTVADVLPEPPGLAEFRGQQAAEADRAAKAKASGAKSEVERK